jgi:uncharacterized integral membrane protein
MKNFLTIHIINIGFIALLLVFIGQNPVDGKVKLIMSGFEIPLAILIPVLFFIGINP